MKRPPPTDDPLAELITLRDWLRYAVTRFTAAKLVFGHGTQTALDEAAFLALHALHLPIDQLEPYLDARLLPSERRALLDLFEARITTRKPAPYLTKTAYIGGHDFYVDERVIVPRSYLGELLVASPELIADAPEKIHRILDLCTGSGCLAILAALAFPDAAVDAVDISPDALAVARRNVSDYGLDGRVTLIEGDLFEPLAPDRLKWERQAPMEGVNQPLKKRGRAGPNAEVGHIAYDPARTGRTYDLILSNPPYVDAEGMATLPPEYAHEPALALDGGPDGLALVLPMLDRAGRHLSAHGRLVVELGRAGPALAAARPDLDLLWLDTEASTGEVFAITAASLRKPRRA
jgi:ribosomal protein L3 glutamine methyltransferase